MNKLTPKQKKFCEYYVESGKASESAVKAGYSEKTAQQIAAENLTKPLIKSYIAELVKPEEDERIANGREVMEYFTAVMRGEINDQFNLDAPLQERTKAAQELAKRIIDTQTYGNKTKKVEDDALSKALKEVAKDL